MLQLLRETPPGYGGVERVAHELASAFHAHGDPSLVYCLRPPSRSQGDPLPVAYRRVPLPSLVFGQLLLPLPTSQLLQVLLDSEPLHAHLPCPAVLSLACLARLIRPCRQITIHWHSFLDPAPTPVGLLIALYQNLAQRLLSFFSFTVTTSPVLRDTLVDRGVRSPSIRVLPCSLPAMFEQRASLIAMTRSAALTSSSFRVVSVGRLTSYKRVDWLIQSIAAVPDLSVTLHVVGDGPDRAFLESLAESLIPGRFHFHGVLDEADKIELLSNSDLLVLAANRCNEAFGIVQLEAMACAVPAVAFTVPLSGMAWVSRLQSLPWAETKAALPSLITRLATDPELLKTVRSEARQRYQLEFQRCLWLQRFQQVFST